MTASLIARPGTDEYAPYYGTYIAKVPDGDLRSMLSSQLAETVALIRSIPESRGGHRYAPDKWSIREVLGHLADSERIFSYRALRIARGDATPLPGFEQNDYVPAGGFDARTLRDLADELAAIRQATIQLFTHLDQAALERRGTASGKSVSVRALAYIIAGHELHHVGILKNRYLGS
jgi:uncharacterized damage-inducible protein DinB